MNKRQIVSAMGIMALLLSLCVLGCPTDLDKDGNKNKPDMLAGKLLILQAYGSSSDAAGASHSFVELYNTTDKAINLTGFTLYFADGRRKDDLDFDAAADNDWKDIELNETIPAEGSFLILGSPQSSAARYQITTSGDINSDFTLSNSSFKVVLIRGKVNLNAVQNPFDTDGKGTKVNGYIDMVGARNTAPNEEGSNNYDTILGFETAPARNSASEAVRRKNLSDTNNNSEDFESLDYEAMTDELLAVRKPRNSGTGGWNPFEDPAEPQGPGPSEYAGTLLIFQAYGGTNANGVTHHFVELYNTGDEDIDLDGYSLQYAAASANADGVEGEWNVIPLTDSIPAGHSYLILGQKNVAQTQRIIIEDDAGDIINNDFILSNNGFKLALIHSTKKLTVANPFRINEDGDMAAGYVDMVGASNTFNTNIITGYEGPEPLTALPRNSHQEGIRRINLTDTDVNVDDFASVRYTTAKTPQYPHGVDAYEIEFYTPKNVAAGPWDPMDPPEDPGPIIPTDPTVAGTPSQYAGELLIFQAGAANNGAVSHSFVELYNNAATSINLSTYSLQYAITGTEWTLIKLTGTIPAQGSYFVLGTAGGSGTVPASARVDLSTYQPDQTETFVLGNNGFKVALMANQKKLTVANPFVMEGGTAADYVDMLGAENGSHVDGFETAYAEVVSQQATARRSSLDDTDDNSADFVRIDYRTAQGMNDDRLEEVRPRNSIETANGWDPFEEPGGDEETVPGTPSPYAGTLLIFQAYGGNNANGVTHHFVELYNKGAATINLDGYSLQYAAASTSATTAEGDWNVIPLTGSIPAGCSYLILGQKNPVQTQRIIIADGSGNINDNNFVLSNNGFKLALIHSTKKLTVANPFRMNGAGEKAAGYVDMVGASNTFNNNIITGYEGPAPLTALPRNSAQEGIRRINLTDTDVNTTDFTSVRYTQNRAANANGIDNYEIPFYTPKNVAAGAWDPLDPPEPPPPSQGTPMLMILQANIRGNDNGLPNSPTGGGFARSLVELYNNTDEAIDLSDYSLHIGQVDTWYTRVQLSKTIPAQSSFLIVSNAPESAYSINATPRASLPAADLEANFIIGLNAAGNDVGNSWKIALMVNQPTLLTVANPFTDVSLTANYVDMLGVGNNTSGITGFEGARASGSAPQPPRRISLTDTDNNSTDFAQADLRGRTGSNGKDDDQLFKIWPRNSTMGAWDPITGLPARHPTINTEELGFSHDSGLYSSQFNLTLTAPEGSAVYYSTDGSVPSPDKVGNGFVFQYSSPIAVQNRNGQPNVLATPAARFYGEPHDRGNNMPSVYNPTSAQVPKATVIRAMAVDAGGAQSGVVTKTYFIGNNLANYSNHRIISLVSDPYNLVDTDYGIMVRGDPSNRWDGPNIYNFQRKGQDWERPAYLELFEGDASSRNVRLSTGVGIRVRGGWSRAIGQKSFSVYFKDIYGINNLRNYTLIPGAVKADGKTPVDTFKGFMLRNGANDSDYTKFYDVFLQELLSDRSFSTQASVPCVVYLNGEYWGPYNLQERYSDNHTEYKYGVDKDNVISYDNGELDDGNPGDDTLYYWPMMNMRNKDMSIQSNYDDFCALFDIDNFVDYFAAQIYIYNEDWPHNNYRLWRTRDAEPGNPYGDTKWRWQMFDTEFAMGIYSSGGLAGQSDQDAFYKILNGANQNHHNNLLFKKLLANQDFCRKFVNTMMDLYNVNFHPDKFEPILNSYANTYRPLMNGYLDRWNGWWNFDGGVNNARTYLTSIRNTMTNTYLPTYFNGYSGIANIGISSGNLRDVTLSVSGVSGASIKINTVTPKLVSGSWTGKYYSSNPITVTASVPPSGYVFDNWAVSGGSAASPTSLTTSVTFTGNVQIQANYRSL